MQQSDGSLFTRRVRYGGYNVGRVGGDGEGRGLKGGKCIYENNQHFICSIWVLIVTGVCCESPPLKAIGKTLWASNVARTEKEY